MPPKQKQQSHDSNQDAFRNELQSVCEAERDNITLLLAPVLTLRLFIEIVVVEGISFIIRLIRHPVTLFIVVPFLAVAVVISTQLIPHQTEALFNMMDQDNNGFITATEVASTFAMDLPTVQRSCFSDGKKNKLTLEEFQQWSRETSFQDEVRSMLYHLPHHPWREVEYILCDVLWWFGLGVLSSVGLGTGMHSGLLFLFPHIFLTCSSADACHNGNFWTYPTNIFFGPRHRTFNCIATSGDTEELGFWMRLLKVAPWCIIWGAGTALGEVPPYLVSYTAAKEGKTTAELEEVSSFDLLNRMKKWMLDKIQRYGFWAILLLAAWPNAAFDLCGMACGQFMMPFWTFFGATFIGKALIKINFQSAFFVALFSGDSIFRLVERVGHRVTEWSPEILKPKVTLIVNTFINALNDTHAKIAKRAQQGARHQQAIEEEESTSTNWLQVVFQWGVVFMVGWFAKSIVDTFAQKRQRQRDTARIKEIINTHYKNNAALSADKRENIIKELKSHLKRRWLINFIAAIVMCVGMAVFVYPMVIRKVGVLMQT